jgi:peptide/nickel transport system substrate-binding protein
MMKRTVLVWMLAALVASGCAGAATPVGSRTGGEARPSGESPSASRTVRVAVRYEIDNLASKVIGPNGPAITRRLFNAYLAIRDAAGVARPYLAETLPQLNSESWRVFPDGRMETIYTLRPNLTWHDGTPLTTEDFAFAYQVYTTPGIGIFIPDPQDQIAEVVAQDARTLLIRWSSPYFEAGALNEEKLDPLPRHLLERGFAAIQQDEAAREAFVNQSYWTNEYVGAGPYRLTQWVPGSQIEGAAFDGHALGKPKIGRLIIRVFNDENTTLTNVLAGELDATLNLALRFEHAQVLRRDWEARGAGIAHVVPGTNSSSVVQFRPEYQKTRGLLDVRVRRALAHAIDRQAINEGVFDGQGFPVETFISPLLPYYAEVDRTITKYPLDLRRTADLMTEAGFVRDRDGLFASPSGERFKPDFWVTAGAQYERHQAIMVEAWKRAGIDTEPYALPLAAGRVNEVRATFPGLTQIGIGTGEDALVPNFISAQIGTAANGWKGSNRGGWNSPEIDRLVDAFTVTLDPAQRSGTVVAITKHLSEEVPAYPLYANISVRAQSAGLIGNLSEVVSTTPSWNVHEWELR